MRNGIQDRIGFQNQEFKKMELELEIWMNLELDLRFGIQDGFGFKKSK